VTALRTAKPRNQDEGRSLAGIITTSFAGDLEHPLVLNLM
jgi:hypothetical protein